MCFKLSGFWLNSTDEKEKRVLFPQNVFQQPVQQLLETNYLYVLSSGANGLNQKLKPVSFQRHTVSGMTPLTQQRNFAMKECPNPDTLSARFSF